MKRLLWLWRFATVQLNKMRAEHEIILSLYYTGADTKAFSDAKIQYSMDLDMEQLLLMMEGVFDVIEYKYCIGDGKIQAIPSSNKEAEYAVLIESTEEERKKAGLLAVADSSRVNFQKSDYEKIASYKTKLPSSKKHLYFFNILVQNINGTNKLAERESLSYYQLFSIKGGKELVSCLLTMTLQLAVAYQIGGYGEANKVIASLDEDYKLMRKLYDKAPIFLNNMQSRERHLRNTYQLNVIINQSRVIVNWIENHRKIIERKDFLDFIFCENITLKNYALHFMYLFTRINRALMGERCIKMQWDKDFDFNTSVLAQREFTHLDNLVTKLEERELNACFDMNSWVAQYTAKLYAFATELRYVSP